MSKKNKPIKQIKKRPVRQVKKKNGQLPSAQQHLPFAEIRDDIVIMKDGTLRTVILVSSLNFALKSEDEQTAIIQGYVSFLNTIDFPLQVVIQSRKLNIEKYLDKLQLLARQHENELLRKQTLSYRSFVSKLVEEADIMDKKFYVIVPFSPTSNKKKNFWSRLQETISPASIVKLHEDQLAQYKVEMARRLSVVISGLQSISLQTQILDTQALIELYYNTYNPVTKQKRRIEDMTQMQIDTSIQ
ncbi:MAG: hypothetical protein HYV32_03260 [Candidatus Kerfeldbacteria bacterium]|nr:hypothetical protein [Candidatus Kerfeldbacteria bacterium]